MRSNFETDELVNEKKAFLKIFLNMKYMNNIDLGGSVVWVNICKRYITAILTLWNEIIVIGKRKDGSLTIFFSSNEKLELVIMQNYDIQLTEQSLNLRLSY